MQLTLVDFMDDLKGRLTNRIQLTTYELQSYPTAVDNTFGSESVYAMVIKIYIQTPEVEKRYISVDGIATESKIIQGNPDKKKFSISYVER